MTNLEAIHPDLASQRLLGMHLSLGGCAKCRRREATFTASIVVEYDPTDGPDAAQAALSEALSGDDPAGRFDITDDQEASA